MPKAWERNNVFELNAGERRPTGKGVREPNAIARHVRHSLVERTDPEPSALDQLMTILDGRRGH